MLRSLKALAKSYLYVLAGAAVIALFIQYGPHSRPPKPNPTHAASTVTRDATPTTPIMLPPLHYARNLAVRAYNAGMYSAATQWFPIADANNEGPFTKGDYFAWTVAELVSGNISAAAAVEHKAGELADPRLVDAVALLTAEKPAPFSNEADCSGSGDVYVRWEGTCARTFSAFEILRWLGDMAAKRGAHYPATLLYSRSYALAELLGRHGLADNLYARLTEQIRLLPFPLAPTPDALRSQEAATNDDDPLSLRDLRLSMLSAPWWPTGHRNYALALSQVAERSPEALRELQRYDALTNLAHPELDPVRSSLQKLVDEAENDPARYRVSDRLIEVLQ